ncbi:GAF domain-containing sensor histidine kinase [Rufibacter sp. DG15C]|uniref:sensor histidine kinase n=1 Tax=Rufibacter sp. DG15C TaxID=1379909 RepID=UPI000830B864|nr:GAF domain-containing sensor histidine kinase [Rufibacter sp. DG15C]
MLFAEDAYLHSPKAGQNKQDVQELERELEETKKRLQRLQEELYVTKGELHLLREQQTHPSSLGTRLDSSRAELDLAEYKRIVALERLGKEVLERNASPHYSLQETIAFYLSGIEKIHGDMLLSFMRLQGDKLYTFAAPSLPASYGELLNGTPIGDNVGSCGTAAFFKEKVIVTDIANDKRWSAFKDLALSYGLKASWSFPIIGGNQQVLGTLAVYYRKVKAPTPAEESSLDSIRNLLQLILESKLAEEALRQSNDRYHLATAATNDAIYDWDIVNNSLYWGIGFEKVFGFKRTPQNSTLDFWTSLLHPLDKESTSQSLDATLQDRQANKWQIEYRSIREDGATVYIEERGFIIRDEAGNAVRMVGAVHDITERRHAEEELRKLSVIAKETSNGVLILQLGGELHWVNDAFTRMMGWTLTEVLGKSPGSLMNGEETDPATIAQIHVHMDQHLPFECELIQYSKTGQKYWFRLQIQPLEDSNSEVDLFFVLLTDITQKKEEEQQLRLLESVITNTKDAIAISKVDPVPGNELETIFVNPAFTQLTGYTPEDVLGKELKMLSGPSELWSQEEALVKFSEAIAHGETYEVELINYRKNGEKYWAHLESIPIYNKAGEHAYWLFVHQDITARKNYLAEREVLIAELTQNNADLKQFSFITSHNLRAPLSNLVGISNLIDLEAIPEGRNRLLVEKFKESTQKLNHVIDDLLEILIIKNNVALKKERLSLASAFEKVQASLDRLLQEAQAQVQVDFSGGHEVVGNAGYLHSILLNLLSNAIKYRSPERPLQVHLKTERNQDMLELSFSDNGLGMDLNRYGDRIFGLYQRFHDHADSKGMGLYIVHSQIKAMGGTIFVSSEVNKGTTFVLQFKTQ